MLPRAPLTVSSGAPITCEYPITVVALHSFVAPSRRQVRLSLVATLLPYAMTVVVCCMYSEGVVVTRNDGNGTDNPACLRMS